MDGWQIHQKGSSDYQCFSGKACWFEDTRWEHPALCWNLCSKSKFGSKEPPRLRTQVNSENLVKFNKTFFIFTTIYSKPKQLHSICLQKETRKFPLWLRIFLCCDFLFYLRHWRTWIDVMPNQFFDVKVCNNQHQSIDHREIRPFFHTSYNGLREVLDHYFNFAGNPFFKLSI